jgi:hypothetical protein
VTGWLQHLNHCKSISYLISFSIIFLFFSIIRCDAEPIALARYVLALVAKDKPLDKLRENCIDRLEVFLDRCMKIFFQKFFLIKFLFL